jgi:tRNA threonylcarbamoyladenosine biosynthesis protein TsaE
MAKADSFGEGKSLQVISESPQFTHLIGKILGAKARIGDVFCLEGELGSGKTCLIGGIAEGLEVEEGIFSPSFIIVAPHRGKIPLFHIDLYRLEEEDIRELGLEEYIYGKGVCAIEWAEKARKVIPPSHLWIRIEYHNRGRLINFFPQGERYIELLRELREFAGHRN